MFIYLSSPHPPPTFSVLCCLFQVLCFFIKILKISLLTFVKVLAEILTEIIFNILANLGVIDINNVDSAYRFCTFCYIYVKDLIFILCIISFLLIIKL